MRPLNLTGRVAVTVFLLAYLIGCAGFAADKRIDKTRDLVGQMTTFNAELHAPNDFDEVKRLLSQATEQLAAKQNSEALDTARAALERAETLLPQVLSAEANRLWQESTNEIEVADRNQLNIVESAAYQNILQLRSQAEQARAESDHRVVIERSNAIVTQVQTLLSSLRNEADTRKIQAENKLSELRSIGGNRWAPEMVIQVTDVIERADRLVAESRDYISATNQYEQAVRQADIGIDTVRQRESADGIRNIEGVLDEALASGALQYHPDEYDSVGQQLEAMVVDFNDRFYNRVQIAVQEVLPRAETLKVEVKRRRSADQIARMRRSIDALIEAGARDYLPGRVEVLQQLREEAIAVDSGNQEANFDEVDSMFGRFEGERENILTAFNNLATEEIRLAGNQVETTERVFSQVQRIFAPADVVPAGMESFEESKASRQQQLASELQQARRGLENAEDLRRAERFQVAIETAQDQARVANNILGEIYRFTSLNAVIELSNLISRYENDGARIYAPSDLERSNRDLDRVKTAIDQGEYVLASELAGAARANIELMAQRISGRAVVDLRSARETLTSVTSAKTRQYAPELLAEVQTLIAQAEDDLQEGRLKLAVEKSNLAMQTAQNAQNQANRLAAQDAIAAAETMVARAENAGANLYAGRDMENARQLLDSATGLFATGDFIQAEELAVASHQRANDGFFKKVTEAEAAIADAKALGGWELDNQRLSQASANAREARQLLEAGAYRESQQLADSALSRAQGVARSSKQSNYQDALARIRQNIDVGTDQGINYFQVGDSIEVRRRLSDIESRWTIGDYDKIMAELTELEGRLRITLDSTDDVVETVARQQTERLDRLVGLGALSYGATQIESARADLRAAVLDYRKGYYKAAHTSLDRAIRNLDEVERRYQQEAYVASILELFERYDRAQQRFRNVLTLGPTEMKALAFSSATGDAMVAIAGSMNPNEFRDEVELLYSMARQTDVPAGLSRIHADVLEALNKGRLSAIHFEKLVIMNEASRAEATRLIDSAYREINQSNQLVSQLRRDFFRDEIDFRLVQAR